MKFIFKISLLMLVLLFSIFAYAEEELCFEQELPRYTASNSWPDVTVKEIYSYDIPENANRIELHNWYYWKESSIGPSTFSINDGSPIYFFEGRAMILKEGHVCESWYYGQKANWGCMYPYDADNIGGSTVTIDTGRTQASDHALIWQIVLRAYCEKAVPPTEVVPVAPPTTHKCSDPSQIIFRMSNSQNAHAEVFNGAGNYPFEVCYDEIFDLNGIGDRDCTGSNTVLKLSDTTNAHIGGTGYNVNVCYENLECDYATDCQNLGEEYKCLASISDVTNAHAGNCDTYENKICCKAEEIAPPCEPTSGEETKELTCNDGKDNDCDNDTDCADLDCSGAEGCGCEECGISILYLEQLFCTEQACNTLSKLIDGGCYYLKDKKCLPCSDVNSCLNFGSQSQCEFNNCNLDCEWDSQNEICFNLLCGNGEIDDGETCSSCPADAGCGIGEVCQNGECSSCSEGDTCVIGCDTVDPDCDCDGSDPDCGVQPVECDNDNICERGENCLCEDCSEPNFDDWDNLLIDGCGYGYICSEGACDCNNEIEDGICIYDESEEAVCPDDPDCFVPPDVNECFGQICSVDEFCIYDTDIVMYSEPPTRCCTIGNCGNVANDIPSIGKRTVKTHGKCLNVDSEGKGQYDVTTKIYESNNLISSETTKESCTVLIGEVPFFTFFNLILTLVILGLFYLIKK